MRSWHVGVSGNSTLNKVGLWLIDDVRIVADQLFVADRAGEYNHPVEVLMLDLVLRLHSLNTETERERPRSCRYWASSPVITVSISCTQ